MIFLVLKSGGEYTAEDVERLLPALGPTVICLSDVAVPCERIALQYGWPGWWSKMELFRPDIPGDHLYLDLDTIVRGDISHMAQGTELALLRDFYRQDGLGSGVMFLPEVDRVEIWRAWIASPNRWIGEHVCGGDQEFLERFWLKKAKRLQDLYPGEIASYKASPWRQVEAAKVVCFHGHPKPRDVHWKI